MTARMLTEPRRDALAALEGLISAEVGLRLAELAASVPEGQAIVEIGSYKGKSTCYLAEGARLGSGSMVYAIDPWQLPGNPNGRFGFNEANTRASFQTQIESVDLDEYIVPVTSFSATAARVWQRGTDGRPIGLLYIDGSHTYADVRDDVEAWGPHLAADALVVFDDYQTPRNPGVAEVVDELRADPAWGAWEFTPPPLAITRRQRSW